MIIVSQNKKMIVNFNNIVSVYVIEDYEQKNSYNIDFSTNDEINLVLANYKTEERAREVLEQIAYKYSEYVSIKDGVGNVLNIAIIPRVYEMPKE